jgi:protein-disulfide isomerase
VIGRKGVVAGLIGIAVGGAAVALATGQLGGSGSEPGRQRVEKIVHDYVLANPEIIPQAMERLQARDMAKAVDSNRAAFETPFGSAWAGAEQGDVVLVEFFDYACGFCRKSNPDIDRLLREDKNLKVVWRELPVLGQDSIAAAQASLAAARHGKFRDFYDRMFEAGRPTAAAVAETRRAVGIASAPASPDLQAEIDKNYQLAQAINATGTPTFVVGDQVLQGAVGYQALKDAIGAARART